MINNVRSVRAILMAAVALGGGQLGAQVWDGGHPSSDDWGSGRNWNPDGPPASDGSADIIMSGTVRLTPNVDQAWDIHSLKFNFSAGAFVTGGSPLIVRAGGIENSSVNVQVFNNNIFPRSSQTWDAFSGPMVFNGLIEAFMGSPTLTVDGDHDVTCNGDLTQSGVVLDLAKTGAGTLTLNGANNNYSGATTVDAGKMLLATNLTTSTLVSVTGGTLELASGGGSNRVIKTQSVSVTGGKIDLKDNKAVITSSPLGSWNGSAYTGVTGLIDSGRGSGGWNGNGIVTSMSDASGGLLTTLAVAKAEDVGYAGGTFAGVSVSAGNVLVMYTWGGDAELDGDLDGDDYFWIDSNVGNSGSVFGFHFGDFDYDGDIDGDDYFIIDSNIAFAQSQPDFPTGAGSGGALTAVPEPQMFTLAGGAALLMRRRRRS